MLSEEELSHILSNMIDEADKEPSLRPLIKDLLDTKNWDLLMKRYTTEGSVWIVWWYDGLNRLARHLVQSELDNE